MTKLATRNTAQVPARSAQQSAEKMHVTPASTNESTIAGPESVIASPMITKIPVPMTAPMPSAVRSRAPTARLRRVLSAVSAHPFTPSLDSVRRRHGKT